MSTRSGKQIHRSSEGSSDKADEELIIMTARKTKSTRLNENKQEIDGLLNNKSKKRNNYVRYPTDDENVVDSGDMCDTDIKHTRVTRRYALKEQNIAIPQIENLETLNTSKKQVRVLHRKKKFTENDVEIAKHHDPVDKQEPILVQKVKTKKSKKNKNLHIEEVGNVVEPVIVKKKSKKKKGKMSSSLISEEENVTDNLNISKDSFHSACGSPINNGSGNNNTKPEIYNNIHSDIKIIDNKMQQKCKKGTKKENNEIIYKNDTHDMDKSLSESSDSFVFQQGNDINNELKVKNSSENKIILEKPVSDNEIFGSSKKRKYTETICEKENVPRTPDDLKFNEKRSLSNKNNTSLKKMDTTFEKEHNLSKIERKSVINNTTFEKDSQQSHNKSSETSNRNKSPGETFTFNLNHLNHDKPYCFSAKLNSTFEKHSSNTLKNLNATFEIENDIFSLFTDKRKSGIMNTTFEKDTKTISNSPKLTSKRSSSTKKKLNGDNKNSNLYEPGKLNNTFELTDTKESSVNIKNSLDKSTRKSQNVTDLGKEKKMNTTFEKDSSVISSDGSKCQDLFHITITSDESVDQDLNKTSDDDEASDDSNVDKSSNNVSSKEVIMNTTPFLIESSLDETILNVSKSPKKETITPLKREGTFTKDSPDVLVSIPAMGSSAKVTPNKYISLPSPGSTPFPGRSSQKGQVIHSVMRSLEKISNSPLGVPVQRATTRVMFCSPINDPAATTQQKRKVIKSSLKGSNKSFLFQETDSPARAAPRKRSYTQNDAEYEGAKRKRLTEDMQLSVDRLSRPRTFSATAKLTESTTPSRKEFTPSKDKTGGGKVSRTKLPNFAALHQKQFSMMESLDECQERKAKRARQLLSPVTGTATTVTKNPLKESNAEVQKEMQKPTRESTKKLDFAIKPSTLPSQKVGYTRFGYKLNLDVNPFSIPSKNRDGKAGDSKQKGPVRQATMPSMTGATSVRQEAAKQVIMRGKSLTNKNITKRNETRTIIKGVRTNRRFELQMKLRNIE